MTDALIAGGTSWRRTPRRATAPLRIRRHSSRWCMCRSSTCGRACPRSRSTCNSCARTFSRRRSTTASSSSRASTTLRFTSHRQPHLPPYCLSVCLSVAPFPVHPPVLSFGCLLRPTVRLGTADVDHPGVLHQRAGCRGGHAACAAGGCADFEGMSHAQGFACRLGLCNAMGLMVRVVLRRMFTFS
jgi:hypothetical protein